MKLAVVTPWFGKDARGGAETHARRLAEELAALGNQVEVLTTCSKRFHSAWTNDLPAGTEKWGRITVRRFPVNPRNVREFDGVNAKLMAGKSIGDDEEQIYFENIIRSDSLAEYIRENKKNYDFFLAIPYMFGTTADCCEAVPEKTVLEPCLHDESYARLGTFGRLFPKVRAMIFLSEPEKRLAESRYDTSKVKKAVLGSGADAPEKGSEITGFRKKHGLGERGYFLCLGRKDEGKNAPQLAGFYGRYFQGRENAPKLVFAGTGQEIAGAGILDAGLVSETLKGGLLSECTALINPSINESFSIVIFEAWHCGRPVMVNADCPVTKYQCEKSNGGLYYRGYAQFAQCLDLLSSKKLAQKLGRNGKTFAKRHEWKKIARDHERFLEELLKKR